VSIKSDNRHLYLQVIDKIKRDIETGYYKEKEKLPSEFLLAKQLGVSRATLREALRILEEENVVIRRHGVGTFVSTRPLFSSGIEQLNTVTDMIIDAGMRPGTIFLTSTTQVATEEDIKRFHCAEGEEFVLMERVRTANGDPVIYCIDKIPSKMMDSDFSHQEESLLDFIHKKTGKNISYAVTHIEPLGYHDKISPILECDPETALLVLKQMHFDENDEAILYSLNYFKADKFDFYVVRKRINIF
jgi:GntR family transcriptional regulator